MTLLYAEDTDPLMEMDLAESKKKCRAFCRTWKKREDYLREPSVLKQALDEYEALLATWGTSKNVGYYWSLRYALDQSNPSVQGKNNKIQEHCVDIENELEFFIIRISQIPSPVQKKLLSYQPLSAYYYVLSRLFEIGRYYLTEDQERIVNIKNKTSHDNWVRMTAKFLSNETRNVRDEDGKVKSQNFSQIQNLMQSRTKSVRESAARQFHKINREHADIAEAEINSVLENKHQEDRLRKYSRPDSARHIADDIPSEIVDSMIQAVASTYSHSKRYYRIKARLLGQRRLRYHERNVPYGTLPDSYTFEESAEIVEKAITGVDQECGEIATRLIRGGHIDIYPKKGKRGGAFCTRNLIGSPVYILLNHTGSLSDVLTLAHEIGHAIHNTLMARSQNALTYGSPLSTAEVASTFFEDFVLEELLSGVDDQMKLAVMVQKLNDDISSIYRQVAAYRFEQDLHAAFRKSRYVSKEEIGTLFRNRMEEYMGEYVKQDPGSENWWVYWSHFRRFFYVYSYASGLIISKTLQRLVRKERSFVGGIKVFLSAGSSSSPVDLFRSLGVSIDDPEFWLTGLKDVESLLTNTEDLAERLGVLSPSRK